MSMRSTIIACTAVAALVAGCGSSPYVDAPNWLTADNSPVWTAPERADFVDSITPGETTLGEVTARYGPAMAYSNDADGSEITAELVWYGKTGFDQPWAAVVIPGYYQEWSDASPVLAVYNSEGARKTQRDTGGSVAKARPAAQASPSAAAQTPPEGEGDGPEEVDASAVALADGVIGPDDIDDDLAAEMAAFGETGATVADFRSEYGAAAEYQEDVRFFRKVGSTLYYGSGYGDGPSIWVEFDGNDRYRSAMIHVPRGRGQAPYERFF
ncbi:hypothetical protein FF098_014375 [Parvularcula flava]|uniref:Uncharacterized protein n=1 Tax=Aquisalinus luteolus TaxID=1566827 RepID=A0A8J3A5E9_9PROT|nr:hypothetical protein [Aquisalinus luteolus]NHK29105.1 hypothetical protein [Aquisalinus luteolus]GGI00289.1 hypothetical protein GCM10011355_28230 [Aquisalinus luteolus]